MVALRVASAVLFVAVAVIALTMARNGLTARRLLPFHEAATGRSWDDASPGEQSVSLALTRVVGLGFLAAAVALLSAAASAVARSAVATYTLAATALVFCAGLTVVNRRLQQETSVGTPWKGSLYASLVILVAAALFAVGAA